MIILAIVAVLFVSIRQSQRVRDTSKLVSHTQEVLFHIQKLVLFALDNETAARGYALSADSEFLEPVSRSVKDIHSELALLKTLLVDNVAQKAAIDSMKVYLDKRIEYSEQTITVRREKGLEAAAARVMTGQGKYYTDQVRRIGNYMQEEENSLLEKRKASNEQTVSQLSILLYSALAIVFFLGIYIINRVSSDIIRQKTAEKRSGRAKKCFRPCFIKARS